VVKNLTCQSLNILGARTKAQAYTAMVIMIVIASNIAKLPQSLERVSLVSAASPLLGTALSPSDRVAELKPASVTVSSRAALRAGSV
jgi:hypothetical protein